MTANEIKQWQTGTGLNQQQAARRVGVPLRTYTRWLTGKGTISQLGLTLLERAGVGAAGAVVAGEQTDAGGK